MSTRPRLVKLARAVASFPAFVPGEGGREDGIARGANDLVHDPLEVLHRAAGVFRMAGHVLGQRFLHRLGHVVSLVDDDLQSITPLRTADPLGGNPVGLRDPLLNLSPVLVFVLRHFEPPTSSASSPGDRAHSTEAASMFAHNATSCMHSAWPTSGRRSP